MEDLLKQFNEATDMMQAGMLEEALEIYLTKQSLEQMEGLGHFQEDLDEESVVAITKAMSRFYNDVVEFLKEGVLPESEKGQTSAKVFWETMVELTGGNMELMQKLNEHFAKIFRSDQNQGKNLMATQDFMQSALDIYFNN